MTAVNQDAPAFPPAGVAQIGTSFVDVGSPVSSFYTESGYTFLGFWPNPTVRDLLGPGYTAAGYDVSNVLVLSDLLDAFRASKYPHMDPLTSISVTTTVSGTVADEAPNGQVVAPEPLTRPRRRRRTTT